MVRVLGALIWFNKIILLLFTMLWTIPKASTVQRSQAGTEGDKNKERSITKSKKTAKPPKPPKLKK